MGGPDVPAEKASAEEIERVKIAEEQWANYINTGKPLASKLVANITGMQADNGALSPIAGNRVLNNDGSVKTDSLNAQAQVQREFANATAIDPNSARSRNGMTDLIGAKAKSLMETDSGSRLAQQNRYLKGIENTIALGRGEQGAALKGLSELSAQAQTKAATDAQNAFANQSADRALVGQLAGAGTSYVLGKGMSRGQDTDSTIKNAISGQLYGIKDNGLKDKYGRPYYDPKNDFYA